MRRLLQLISGLIAENRGRLISSVAGVVLWTFLLLAVGVWLIRVGVTAGADLPTLKVALSVASALVGLALASATGLRFTSLGDPRDLLLALGFGLVALADLLAALVGPSVSTGQVDTLAWLGVNGLVQGSAAVAFLGALVIGRPMARASNPGLRMIPAGLLFAIMILAGVCILLLGVVRLGAPAEQLMLLALAQRMVGLLFLTASVAYVMAASRPLDPRTGTLSAFLALLCLAQLRSVAFGYLGPGYVGGEDVLRLIAILVLLSVALSRRAAEISERAARAERVRLSSELHDGLVQHLALLGLRLDRALEADRPVRSRAEDLKSASRLVTAALLEARQAIAPVRAGSLTWEELSQAMGSFADQFSNNSTARVYVHAQGSAPYLSASVGADVLKILMEACSNAVRHGSATRIDVSASADDRDLLLEVIDNGYGFKAQRRDPFTGLGLGSMSERVERHGGQIQIRGGSGEGTVVQLRIPLAGQRLRWA